MTKEVIQQAFRDNIWLTLSAFKWRNENELEPFEAVRWDSDEADLREMYPETWEWEMSVQQRAATVQLRDLDTAFDSLRSWRSACLASLGSVGASATTDAHRCVDFLTAQALKEFDELLRRRLVAITPGDDDHREEHLTELAALAALARRVAEYDVLTALYPDLAKRVFLTHTRALHLIR